MTSETASSTEPWIEQHKAKYAYCYDKAGKMMSAVGASGYPSAVLVDPAGNIVWQGHPSEVNAAIIEPALKGAMPKPLWEWPDDAKKVKKAVIKRNLAEALQEATALGEPGTEVRVAIEGLIAGKLASLKAAQEEKDWLRVDVLGDELSRSFKGLPQEAEVATIVAALKADKEAQTILAAQERVAKVFAGDIKRKQIDKLKKDLQKIAEEHPGTAAERDAKAGIEELEKLRQAMLNR